jgi:hypothetical protein
MKTHKTAVAPDGGYELLCNYEPVNKQRSGIIAKPNQNEYWDWRWTRVNCPECLKLKKLTREK